MIGIFDVSHVLPSAWCNYDGVVWHGLLHIPMYGVEVQCPSDAADVAGAGPEGHGRHIQRPAHLDERGSAEPMVSFSLGSVLCMDPPDVSLDAAASWRGSAYVVDDVAWGAGNCCDVITYVGASAGSIGNALDVRDGITYDADGVAYAYRDAIAYMGGVAYVGGIGARDALYPQLGSEVSSQQWQAVQLSQQLQLEEESEPLQIWPQFQLQVSVEQLQERQSQLQVFGVVPWSLPTSSSSSSAYPRETIAVGSGVPTSSSSSSAWPRGSVGDECKEQEGRQSAEETQVRKKPRNPQLPHLWLTCRELDDHRKWVWLETDSTLKLLGEIEWPELRQYGYFARYDERPLPLEVPVRDLGLPNLAEVNLLLVHKDSPVGSEEEEQMMQPMEVLPVGGVWIPCRSWVDFPCVVSPLLSRKDPEEINWCCMMNGIVGEGVDSGGGSNGGDGSERVQIGVRPSSCSARPSSEECDPTGEER